MARPQKKIIARKIKRKVTKGVIHIQASFNNTIVTVTDIQGNVIAWSSAGACGFKGARKETPFAAKTAAENAARQSLEFGMRTVEVVISGAGAGRETAIRSIKDSGLGITRLKDITPLPHNGCRPPKKRRM